ncbi:MAG: cysteine synthase family protein [Paucibacter sp.]|nr:cysteine synthase family protein [Roseateles sp.]
MKVDNVLATIGNTPHIRMQRLFGTQAQVWIKSERSNPGGSIKDRIALAMVEDAEARGLLQRGAAIIAPTSGNTGVGLAMVAAVKGYKLITGVGTGGHITGCAQVLKKAWPNLQVFAVEPSASPVISGGAPAPHPIQGIGAGFIPTNLHTALLDGVIQVEAEEAREYARRSAAQEGLLVGISSGATLAAIAKKLAELPAGARVLGFNYDTGERYLSIEGFLPA